MGPGLPEGGDRPPLRAQELVLEGRERLDLVAEVEDLRQVGVREVADVVGLAGAVAGDHRVGVAVPLPDDAVEVGGLAGDRVLVVVVPDHAQLLAGGDAAVLEGARDRDVRHVGGRPALAGHLVLDRDRLDVGLLERGKEGDVVEVLRLEVDDDRRGVGAVERRDVLPPGGPTVEARVVGVHDPLPGGLEVGARDRRAVGPEEAVTELEGDLHPLAVVAGDRDAAVLDGRQRVLGEVARVLEVVGGGRHVAEGRRGDGGLDDLALVVRVEEVVFLPVADDERPAPHAVHAAALIRRVEEVRPRGRRRGLRRGRLGRRGGRSRGSRGRGRGRRSAAGAHEDGRRRQQAQAAP